MKQRIARVSVHQTSLVLAVVYAIVGLVMGLLFSVISLVDPTAGFPIWTVAIFPILYAIIGYISTAVMLVVYNWLATFTGGIEVTLTPASDATTPA